jgi:hypothetical protein
LLLADSLKQILLVSYLMSTQERTIYTVRVLESTVDHYFLAHSACFETVNYSFSYFHKKQNAIRAD